MTIFSIIFFIPSPHFPHSRSFHTQINIFVKSYYAKMRIAAGFFAFFLSECDKIILRQNHEESFDGYVLFKILSFPSECKPQLYCRGHRLRLRRRRRQITQAVTEQIVNHTRCLVPDSDQQQVGRTAMRTRHRPFAEFLAHAALRAVRCVCLPLIATFMRPFPCKILRQSFGAPHQ